MAIRTSNRLQAAPSITDQFQLPDLPGGAVVPGVPRSFDVGTPTPIELPEVRIEGDRVVVRSPPPAEPAPQSSVIRRLGGAAAGLALAGLERLLWVLTPSPLGDSDLLSKLPPQPLPQPRAPTFTPAAPPPDELLPEVVITPPRAPPRDRPSASPDDLPNWRDIANRPYDPFREPIYPRQPWLPDFGSVGDPYGFAAPIGDPVPRRRDVPARPGRGDEPVPGIAAPDLQPFNPELPAPDRAAPDVRTAPRPGVGDQPFRDPRPAPAPRPTPRPVPDPFAPGFPDPFTPPRVGTPLPTLPPRTAVPNPFVPPVVGPELADPFTPTRPPNKADGCNCDKEPKKKKKKSKEREVCYTGTYTQRRKGIVYKPRKEVPCNQAEAKLPRRPNPRYDFEDLARVLFPTP